MTDPEQLMADGQPRREFSFKGLVEAEPDWAERSEEIMREELERADKNQH